MFKQHTSSFSALFGSRSEIGSLGPLRHLQRWQHIQRSYSTRSIVRIHLKASLVPACSVYAQRFSTYPRLGKKKSRADREAEDKVATKSAEDSDPYDYSDLKAGIEKCQLRMKAEFEKILRGRSLFDTLDNMRVAVQRDIKRTEQLSNLAHIVPMPGRKMSIQVGDKAHLKPIIAAIQASPGMNLQPIQDAQDPLKLTLPIPSQTKETRDRAIAEANSLCEMAITGIRATRAVMHKKLRNMELKKLARPDDLKKAHKEMEKLVEKGIENAKTTTQTQCTLIRNA
ncbi:CELP0024 Effector like protein [Golovinomyces cichoracearum]|uniref:CELP0024 Effector like protein n=1 Tax=Golovinomyces cichoracearum TaxID=62708 RepID=A0A420ICD0_9PEZI|nr:CELP0024 Effector like protein [Golovinomyces cichoracearum]